MYWDMGLSRDIMERQLEKNIEDQMKTGLM